MNSTSPSRDAMRFRKLRLAFSAVCGILCLLLIVLWVRSHHKGDVLTVSVIGTRGVGVVSIQGRLILSEFDYQSLTGKLQLLWGIQSYPRKSFKPPGPAWQLGSQTTPYPRNFVVIPHWFALSLVGAVGAVGAIAVLKRPYRFSLRTLLIGTTVVAVVLGLIVWAAN